MRVRLARRFPDPGRLGLVLAAAVALAGGELNAQLDLSPSVNLFGDEIVQKLQGNGRIVRFFGPNGPFDRAVQKPAVEGFGHTITFHDGRQIRGSLVELTKTDVHWKRPDADLLLVFPRDQVRRISLRPKRETPFRPWALPQVNPVDNSAKDRPLATVKLAGGDWLHGEVVGGSGDLLTVAISDGPEVAVDRSCVQWLHFGPKPAPAFGFSGGNLDLEGWTARSAVGDVVIKDGLVTIPTGGWIGRAMPPMQRFELSFELPAESEDRTDIWLQPLGPEVNCYTTGTTVLRLGKKEFTHCVYTQQMQDIRTPLPPEEVDETGSVRYRIRYDGQKQKLTVIRNGQRIGQWNFVNEKNAAAPRIDYQFQINGICLQRRPGSNVPLQIRKLQVQPLTGEIEQVPVGQGNALLWNNEMATLGTLGALGRTDFFFSGTGRPRENGAVLQFANDPKALSDADAVLLFGDRGELSVADLESRRGRLRYRSVFSPLVSMEFTGVEVIAFPAKPFVETTDAGDRLIFKNGDEIAGKLVSAAAGVPIRWRMNSGQEIAFGPEAIAGIRLAEQLKEKATVPPLQPMVELRNGDLIRGEVMNNDTANLLIRNSVLGPIALNRENVTVLLPNAGISAVDGGFHPELWMEQREIRPHEKSAEDVGRKRNWVYLDGTYILQMQGVGRVGWQGAWLNPPVAQNLERFEIRCDITDPNGNDPGFSITLREKDNVNGFQASFVYGRLQIFMHSRKPRGGPNWRHVMYEGKLKDSTSRRRVRMFVDSKLGTVDIFMDGVLLTRIGQQANERLPGIGGNLRIQGMGQTDSALIFSNLWVGPWNGELPTSNSGAGVALSNGDYAAGAPLAFEDGKVRVDSEIGPLDLPADRVVSVNFGAEYTPAQAAARLRLLDGTSLHVDSFQYQDGKIKAKSALLGELNFEVSALAEIVIQPSPVRPPQQVLAKAGATEPLNDEKADQ